MVNQGYKFQINGNKNYLYNTCSLRKTAKNFGINYRTVLKWVSKFKKYGHQSLIIGYNHTNKISPQIVKTIVKIKEQRPALSIRKMKETLHQMGIKISLGALWKILRNSGYAGFKKNALNNDFTDYLDYGGRLNEVFLSLIIC